ncbi:MAG: TRAP transporter small permease [Syntrophus sp. (in: bacteria)]|nr:TRAP transporter small permease [Syntrophus sp. (in: bacteria)]
MTDRWERIDEVIGRVEQALLVVLLSVLILIAFSQIILRNLFSTGIAWGDALVRTLVLWTGFIGATIAAREGKHICIDVVSRWLSPKGKKTVAIIIHGVSFLICCLLIFAALKFIHNEFQMKGVAFLGVPAWVSEIILPLTFAIMAFRYFFHFLKSILGTHRQERDE